MSVIFDILNYLLSFFYSQENQVQDEYTLFINDPIMYSKAIYVLNNMSDKLFPLLLMSLLLLSKL